MTELSSKPRFPNRAPRATHDVLRDFAIAATTQHGIASPATSSGASPEALHQPPHQALPADHSPRPQHELAPVAKLHPTPLIFFCSEPRSHARPTCTAPLPLRQNRWHCNNICCTKYIATYSLPPHPTDCQQYRSVLVLPIRPRLSPRPNRVILPIHSSRGSAVRIRCLSTIFSGAIL